MTGKPIHDLLEFVRTFELEALVEMGIQHPTLMRLVERLGSVEDLVWSILDQEIDLTKMEVCDRSETTRPLILELDALLTTPTIASDDFINQSITGRLSLLLDRIITASVQRLPAELRKRSTEAKVIRSRFHDATEQWKQARQHILASRRQLEFAVAMLAHVNQNPARQAQTTQDTEDTVTTTLSHVEKLERSETLMAELQELLHTLDEQVMPYVEHARRVIHEIKHLRAAVQTLEFTIPNEIDTQMVEWETRLNALLLHIAEDLDVFPQLIRDEPLVQAIEDTRAHHNRIQQILNPIRPSVFRDPLDRPEEIRRLVLMAMYVYTDPYNSDLHLTRRKGIGKRTVPDVLDCADLIDPTEVELATEMVFHFSTPDGLNLIEKEKPEKRRRWWRYKISEEGTAQAKLWLEETRDKQTFIETIEHGIVLKRERAVQA